MTDLTGKVALVTGGAGDIGAATARAFGAAGASVVLTDRRADGLESVRAALASAGVPVSAHAVDQTDAAAVAGLFDDVATRWGRLDVAFVNAGYGQAGALIDMTAATWNKHVAVNLTGSFLIAQGAARQIRRGGDGGALVVNASTAAEHICDLLGAYAVSKAGLRMLAKSLASELGVHRIRVNAVMPGVIETAMTGSLLAQPTVRADVVSNTPSGRIGTPNDIARAVLFLCDPANDYVTGTEIMIDGGQTLHGYPRWFDADFSQLGASWTPRGRQPEGGTL